MLGVTFFGLIFTPVFYVACRGLALLGGARRAAPTTTEPGARAA
jgi:HAE1 family hydrophobic/amphiphilic exporter-1